MKWFPELLKKLYQALTLLRGECVSDDQLDYRSINISTR